MKKSIFGFILAILLICPFMSQVLRAEARDTDSKVTDADKISYYSFDNISGGLIACSDFRWKDQYRKIRQCT